MIDAKPLSAFSILGGWKLCSWATHVIVSKILQNKGNRNRLFQSKKQKFENCYLF